MRSRVWNVAFGAALAAYLVGGTVLLAQSMNAEDDPAGLRIAGALALLFLASFTCPGWWALLLPLVTFVPVAVWGTAACKPGFLDFCDLTWLAAAFVAIVVEMPIAALSTWFGHAFRARRASG